MTFLKKLFTSFTRFTQIVPVLNVLHQNKALYNFCKRGQGLKAVRCFCLDQSLFKNNVVITFYVIFDAIKYDILRVIETFSPTCWSVLISVFHRGLQHILKLLRRFNERGKIYFFSWQFVPNLFWHNWAIIRWGRRYSTRTTNKSSSCRKWWSVLLPKWLSFNFFMTEVRSLSYRTQSIDIGF